MVLAAVYSVLLAVAVLWQCDQVLKRDVRKMPEIAVPAVVTNQIDPAPVFVIFVDSLRLETALDAETMPALARLRREGSFARVNTVYQGHTVPALRALFTGGAPSGVFNVITDFRRSNLQLASLFSELQSAGRRSVAWSSGHFNQFGDSLEQRFVHPFLGPDPMVGRDQRRVREALALFAEGHHALVAAHIEFTDYAGHTFGIYRPDYQRYFGRADALVAEAAARVPPGASLLVLGDHGHDERGVHKAGLDIPTFVVMRGPAFRPGYNLGTIEITEAGYFLHAALRQPVNGARYAHARLDRALLPGFEPPALQTVDPTAPPRRLPVAVLLAAAGLAVVAWSWWGPAGRVDRVARVAGAVGLAVLFAPPAVGAWVAVGAALVALFRHGQTSRNGGRILAATAVAGILIYVGTQLAGASGGVPPAPWMLRSTLLLLGALMVTRPAGERPTWLAVAAALLLWVLEPWQHAGGWLAATTFAGLGVLWLALLPGGRDRLTVAAVGVIALAFAAMYRPQDGGHWNFAVPITLAETVPLGITAGAAKLAILLVVAPAGWRGKVVALACASLLGSVAWFLDRSLLNWHERVATTAVAAGLGLAWLAALWGKRRDWMPLLGLSALFAFYYHGVRAQPYHFAWADLLFCGLFLAARLGRDVRPSVQAPLGAGAVALAFALAQGWLSGGVEWQALYDWIPAQTVEHHVAWFLPWILFRETLPFWIGRYLVVHCGGEPWPAPAVGKMVAVWLLGLILLLAGHFFVHPMIETSQLPAEQMAGLGTLLFATLVVFKSKSKTQAVGHS